MGRFIITRKAEGSVFRLEAENGRLLATSKAYATLDACKKGLVSLVTNAPAVPLVDATAGEQGPNPKFELIGSEGAYIFLLKAKNGKAVLTSPPFATRKAALRAVSMLRSGVADAPVFLAEKDNPRPLKVAGLAAAAPAEPPKKKECPAKEKETATAADRPGELPPAVTFTFDLTEEPQEADEATDGMDTAAAEMPVAASIPVPPIQKKLPTAPPTAPRSAAAPRIVRLMPAPGTEPDAEPRSTAPSVKPPRPATPAKSPVPPKKRETPPPTVRGFIRNLFKK